MTLCLKDLHWLPCYYRIVFKTLVLIHKALQGTGPQYLADMFVIKSGRGRRYVDTDRILDIPFTHRKTFADRSIRVQGAKWWNELTTVTLRTENKEEHFKRGLKTHLFTLAFA